MDRGHGTHAFPFGNIENSFHVSSHSTLDNPYIDSMNIHPPTRGLSNTSDTDTKRSPGTDTSQGCISTGAFSRLRSFSLAFSFALASLLVRQPIPQRHSTQSTGSVVAHRAAKSEKVQPTPSRSSSSCRTETPTTATVPRTIFTEALAVAGLEGCRSIIRVRRTCFVRQVRLCVKES